jgi:hypothetical protein
MERSADEMQYDLGLTGLAILIGFAIRELSNK